MDKVNPKKRVLKKAAAAFFIKLGEIALIETGLYFIFEKVG